MAVSVQQRLMRERAQALATILLTEQKDVVVDDVREEIGIDLMVRLGRRSGLRQLGVELRYVMEPLTAAEANRVIRPTLATHAATFGPFPVPVVMFLFTMRDDAGWYTWVSEPDTPSAGVSRLLLRESPACVGLDTHSVAELLGKVDRWYDARYTEARAG